MRTTTTGYLAIALAVALGCGAAQAGEAATAKDGPAIVTLPEGIDPITTSAPTSSAASRFDIAFGAGATTDYLARGVSQTSNRPAIQGFVEFDLDDFYAGVWASNVSKANSDDVELDAAVGWRPNFADFNFDFGYVQYIYLNNVMGGTFGELYAGVTRSLLENLAVGAKVSWAPDYGASGTMATYVEATADLKLPHNFGVSGAVGYQFFDSAYATSYLNGNIGLYWNVTDNIRLDLRASTTNLNRTQCAGVMSVGNECGTKIMFGVSFSELASNLFKGDAS